ncbi:pentatricopeptide repeat-containing protein At2g22410, mitochondrial-like [Cucurbita moschata]|uniref:Pentatricopeptide repeat-containing protein At2g22410, mitochondrial-like n=1 Tax=Cucurbita moschata TaxID=3662 RepID=A0A6J1HB35_CUCMO|nr:pentatricopeptide repeat-containing protein At2g22410, mitochondrial-like [Cucurbita moschata]
MKPLFSSVQNPSRFSIFPFKLTFKILHSFRPLSSSAAAGKPKWNSLTNVFITNPTLLILQSCSSMFHLKQIQAHMTCTGLMNQIFPASRVVAFCALSDAGDIHYAHLVFAQIENPNCFLWNTMIKGYCRAKCPSMGFLFFRQMIRNRVELDCGSFVSALKVCGQFAGKAVRMAVHSVVWKLGFGSELLVQNGLIQYYVEIGCIGFARQVFDESSVKDVVTWTTMINGYTTNNCLDEAIMLFDLMSSSNVEPNEVTMIALLSACSQKGDYVMGRSLHELIKRKNISSSVNLVNTMLDMYVKCGCLVTAREIFDNMERRDVFSWTSLLNGLAKNGDLEAARKVFDEMPERNIVSWNAMIAGYSQNSQPMEALKLFHNMVDVVGLVPTEDTLVCVLSACGQLGCLEMGKWIHDNHVNKMGIQLSLILNNAVMDMYAKCGSIDAAAKLFHSIPEKNLVSWNTMISAYASHGHAKRALTLFDQMKHSGLKPDHITFIGVLSACSYGGFVSKGREHFESMENTFGIEPKREHYACMVDLFSRVGLLKEAYELISKMPIKASEGAWGALLDACRKQGNVEMAKLAAGKLLELDPEDSGIYTLLANICADGKRWNDVRMVRRMMRERGVKKVPGHSLIEVGGTFHEFLVADNSHPHSLEVYRVVNELLLLSSLIDLEPLEND